MNSRPAAVPAITIADFEALEFDAESFDHAAHVYVAWLYLRATSLEDTIARYTRTLRRLTERLGVPGKYHQTVTWFLLITIAERLRKNESWLDFRRRNADLLGNARAFLLRRYSPGRLDSPLARQQFLLPDRGDSRHHDSIEQAVERDGIEFAAVGHAE